MLNIGPVLDDEVVVLALLHDDEVDDESQIVLQ